MNLNRICLVCGTPSSGPTCADAFCGANTGPTKRPYSETGPVFVAKPYTYTPEWASEAVTKWSVEDLDGYVLCVECNEANVNAIAKALNERNGLITENKRLRAALEQCRSEAKTNKEQALYAIYLTAENALTG